MSLTPIAFAFALLLVGVAASPAAPVKRAASGHAAAAHPGESSGIGPDFGSYLTFEVRARAFLHLIHWRNVISYSDAARTFFSNSSART